MKTSVKILIGYVALLVVIQIVFGSYSYSQYKKLRPEALRIVEDLEQVRVVDVEFAHGIEKPDYFENGFRKEQRARLEIGSQNLERTTVAGDTLYIKGLVQNEYSYLWVELPRLEKVIIRSDTDGTEVLDF